MRQAGRMRIRQSLRQCFIVHHALGLRSTASHIHAPVLQQQRGQQRVYVQRRRASPISVIQLKVQPTDAFQIQSVNSPRLGQNVSKGHHPLMSRTGESHSPTNSRRTKMKCVRLPESLVVDLHDVQSVERLGAVGALAHAIADAVVDALVAEEMSARLQHRVLEVVPADGAQSILS